MIRFWVLAGIGLAILPASLWSDDVTPQLPAEVGIWTGADLWANPMEDWSCRQVAGDSVAAAEFSGGDRELVLLTAELNDTLGSFRISATFHVVNPKLDSDGFLGFQLGLRSEFDDYRDSAIYGTGFCAGVRGDGTLFIGGSSADKESILPLSSDRLQLVLEGTPNENNTFDLKLTVGAQEF